LQEGNQIEKYSGSLEDNIKVDLKIQGREDVRQQHLV
jgi:hypothetical protein